jgi:hypothetical protein
MLPYLGLGPGLTTLLPSPIIVFLVPYVQDEVTRNDENYEYVTTR